MRSLFTKVITPIACAVAVFAAEVPTMQTPEQLMHEKVMKTMQDKVAVDINKMIEKYDYKKAYEQAQKDFAAAEEAKEAMRKVKTLAEATTDELIEAMSSRFQKLREKAALEALFPKATEGDAKYFDHLNVKFDLDNHDGAGNVITLETAAKDSHGLPLYHKLWSSKKTQTVVPAVEPVKINVEEAIKAKVAEVAPVSVPIAEQVSQAVQNIVTKIETTSAPEANGISAKRQAELDEARDVAFQVVFFFIFLILASFGLLYIYHKMEQERAAQAGKQATQRKETFFEFLAGQIEDDYPQTARAAGSATRYQV